MKLWFLLQSSNMIKKTHEDSLLYLDLCLFILMSFLSEVQCLTWLSFPFCLENFLESFWRARFLVTNSYFYLIRKFSFIPEWYFCPIWDLQLAVLFFQNVKNIGVTFFWDLCFLIKNPMSLEIVFTLWVKCHISLIVFKIFFLCKELMDVWFLMSLVVAIFKFITLRFI